MRPVGEGERGTFIIFIPAKMDLETDFIGLISSFLGPNSEEDVAGRDASVTPSAAYASSDDIDTLSTQVVIFSKDRPWQLQQLLRSMKLPGDNFHSDDANFLPYVEIFIIFRATTSDFVEGYEQIMQTYHVDKSYKICFLCEGEWTGRDALDVLSTSDNMEDNSFSYLLEYTLDTSIDVQNTPSFVMFLTDDCVFLESFEVVLAHAIGSLQYDEQRDRVFNFSSRLHPGISRCQTRDSISPPPKDWQYHSLVPYLNKLQSKDSLMSTNQHDGVYLYKSKSGSIEWNYLFDLSGGVYRHSDVHLLLKQIRTEDEGCIDKNGLAHPNTFEVRGNEAILALDGELVASKKTLSAIPSRPLLIILAINRVQDICRAPIAGSGEGRVTASSFRESNIGPTDPLSLFKFLRDGQHLNLDKYLATPYNSSHVGDVFLCDQQNGQSVIEEQSFDVSVLIPVNRGVNFASHSIISVIMQCVDELYRPLVNETIGPQFSLTMQIVIVDDRCDDGSIDVMIQSCKTLLASQTKVSLMVIDHRFDQSCLHRQQRQQLRMQTAFSVTVDIISSRSNGVASALNTGLDFCRSELVARMDADDVSAPKRLLTQLRFMKANPSINVVGTSAVIFSAEDNENIIDCPLLPYHDVAQSKRKYRVVRTSLSVSDPGFMAWAMLFSCTIAHPTVLFRKSAIEEIGGYDISIKSSEDYDLWLRLLGGNCRSMLCLPFVGVWHRKHNHSNSVKNSQSQKRESNEVCYRAIKRLLSSSANDNDVILDISHLSTLKNPTNAESLESINKAARLLVGIESVFIHNYSQYLTKHEISLIQNDCNARIGELGSIAINKFGKDGIEQFLAFKANQGPCYVWKLWSERCPHEQFYRLSLVCHATAAS